jgi:hypothetical protein
METKLEAIEPSEIILTLNDVVFWKDFDFWTIVVLGVTFAVLCIYTWFTYQLAKEAKDAREAEFIPFLYVTGSDCLGLAQHKNDVSFDSHPRISLVNIGRGPALDVEMDKFYTDYWVVRTKQSALLVSRPSFDPMGDRADQIVISRYLNHKEGKSSNRLILKCRDLVGNQHFFEYEYISTQMTSVFVRHWKKPHNKSVGTR